MDPRLGTDTSGPGEAVFAIRYNGKPYFLFEKIRWQNTPEKKQKIKYAQTLMLVKLIVVKIKGFLAITRNPVGISGPY